MPEPFAVREPAQHARVIDITGDITAASEDVLMDAYTRASGDGVRAIVLSFGGLEYMNSGGIGLLVTLLVRAHRKGQQVLAFGLSDHYRQIFELTRLDEAVGIHDNEAEALARDVLVTVLGRGPWRLPAMDTDFPYDAVVAEFQRVGKHFVRPRHPRRARRRTGNRFA